MDFLNFMLTNDHKSEKFGERNKNKKIIIFVIFLSFFDEPPCIRKLREFAKS